MPLVVVCGLPSSGKTTWVNKAAEYFRTQKDKVVLVVREEELLRGEKNDVLDDSRKEKELRGKVKSEAQRLLTKENIVIVDALNYIKGYRYELFCISKNIPTCQVTVQCEISPDLAWEWNLTKPEEQQYKRDVFDHLFQRFEHPDPQCRWDSPFFSVLPNEDFDFDAVFNSLFLIRTPKPNQSTQNKPVSKTNFLSSMEKITSDIIQTVLEKRKDPDADIENLEVPHSDQTVKLNESGLTVTLAQLTRFKRQFISLSKTGRSEPKGNIGDMFVQYLNSQFKEHD